MVEQMRVVGDAGLNVADAMKMHCFTSFGQKRIKNFVSTLIRTKLENATLPEKSY